MHKKIKIFMILFVLLLTGCMKIDDNYDAITNEILKNKGTVNTVSTGYELYIPIGVRQIIDNEYNQQLKIKDQNVYLYVDIISYYYQNKLNLKDSDTYSYYYKELNYNNKTGYIGIKQEEDNLYFCKIVYNYSKIEFYSNLDDLPEILSQSLIILNSIKYNDNLIKLSIDNSSTDGREITYELEKPEDSKSSFSQYLQEYVAEDTEEENTEEDNTLLPDED